MKVARLSALRTSLKPYMSHHSLRNIYYSYLHSIMNYDLLFWENCSYSIRIVCLKIISLELFWAVKVDNLVATVAYRGGGGGFKLPPLRNSEILAKLSRIPSSVENTCVAT
jgi:predicted membrane protein